MITTMLAMVLTAQASDTTRTAREAFTGCLRAYVNQNIESATAIDAFRAAYPQQCTAQEAAFREAVIRRETTLRATRANAEQVAREAVSEARTNFAERYEMAMTPE